MLLAAWVTVWGQTMRAAAGTSAVTNAETAAVPALAELKAEESALDMRARELTTAIIKLLNPIREARDKALKTDPELNAMFREIAKQQAAMEKRLLEKFPDIAAKAEESKKLTAEHSKINEKLMAVREKIAKAETAATPEKK